MAKTARRLGHETSLLFGHHDVGSKDPLLREIQFMETSGYQPFRKDSRGRRLARLARTLSSALTARLEARPIELTGRIIPTSSVRRLPPMDALFNARDLHFCARLTFQTSGRWLEVEIPEPPDIMHWTMPIPARVRGAFNLYTLHDLLPLKLPHTTKDIKREYLSVCRKIAREADAILTVSETSKADIVELLDVAPERVINTYQTAGEDLLDASKDAEAGARRLARRYGLSKGGFLLFAGVLEPRKNIDRLIRAYLDSGVTMPLVLVGPVTDASDQMIKHIPSVSPLDIRNGAGPVGSGMSLLRLGHVPRPILIDLMRAARAVLMPSLYEGFGLPPLEAMSLGTPVLTSNNSSLGELFSSASLSVNPYDSEQIRAGIRRLSEDDALCSELVEKGYGLAKEFSQAHFAERLASVYRRYGRNVS
ncbi:glycosyltransferase family 4 protein [Thiohalocapsa marina]|uniref:glycosyltransferase family 4 protein n=1 Tax=Thiohalocapsa marina TaxID=424902 RepID=UPI00147943D0